MSLPRSRSRARSRSRPSPRRVHHHISLSFSTPDTVEPQLYEWVSSGFPPPVHVHYYLVSTTYPPRSSLPSTSSSDPGRSSVSIAESDPGSYNSLLSAFVDDDEDEEVEDSESPSESLVGELRRSLRRMASNEENDVDAATFREDPWTTWFPSTPPLRSREGRRSGDTTPPMYFITPGTPPSVMIHSWSVRRLEMEPLDEGGLETAGNEWQQESGFEQTHGPFEGHRDDDGDTSEGVYLCRVCRVMVQWATRRHG